MPEQVKARHIVTAQEEEAKEIRQALLQGESFESLAREKSISPDREMGGDLGLFKKGEMPKDFDVVFSLKESAISPMVKTPYGFHLFQVEKKFPSRTLSFEEVQLQIQDLLFQIKREGLYEEWLQDLKSASSININLSVLKTET
jgi:parvulin-like peptidyl-prolyl isomerase